VGLWGEFRERVLLDSVHLIDLRIINLRTEAVLSNMV
jgi:hypothetical protein